MNSKRGQTILTFLKKHGLRICLGLAASMLLVLSVREFVFAGRTDGTDTSAFESQGQPKERRNGPATTLRVAGESISKKDSPDLMPHEYVVSGISDEIVKEIENSSAPVAPDEPEKREVQDDEVFSAEYSPKKSEEQSIKVNRYDDDSSLRTNLARGDGPRFLLGSPIVRDGEKVVTYAYVARGAWLIRKFQSHIDRLTLEIRRSDRLDLYDGYAELVRSFAYLCMLVATDDGSDAMLKSIAKGIAAHRETLTRLKLNWTTRSKSAADILDEYIKDTWLKDLERKDILVKPGSMAFPKYNSLADSVEEKGATKP